MSDQVQMVGKDVRHGVYEVKFFDGYQSHVSFRSVRGSDSRARISSAEWENAVEVAKHWRKQRQP